MRPVAHSNRRDRLRLCDEVSPRLTGRFYDRVVVFEHAIGEPVRPQVLPDILDRIQFWRSGGQEDRRDVGGHVEIARRMPSRAIQQQNGVRALCDMARYLSNVKLHGERVGKGKRERRARAARRADRAEQIGVLIALVGWLARPRSTPGPLTNEAIFLTDAGLVLEPYFHRRVARQIGKMGAQRAREVFLYASMISASCPGWRGRAEMCEKPIFFKSVPT